MSLVADQLAFRHALGGGVGPVNLVIPAGQRVVLCSKSGGGKSTLLRALGGLVLRHRTGLLRGRVTVSGQDPAALSLPARAASIGFVPQEPWDSFVCGTLGDEVAFGWLAVGGPREQRAERVASALNAVGLGHIELTRSPMALSGGEMMRLAIAAALVHQPRWLLLDEPLASADARSVRLLLALLSQLAENGTSVVLAEHRLDWVLGWADRVVVLQGGEVVADGPVDRRDLASRALVDCPLPTPRGRPVSGRLLLRFRGPLSRGTVQGSVSVDIHEGERWFILGMNGAGKSTLLAALVAGTTVPVVEVPQDADLALCGSDVEDEVPDNAVRQAIRLTGLGGRPTLALSRGERVRCAVGSALTAGAQLLVLDEPTAGQDRDAVGLLFVAAERFGPTTWLVATHEVELAMVWATHLLVLGESAWVGTPEAFRASPPSGWPHV